MKWFWDANLAKIFEQIGSVPPMVNNFFFKRIALAVRTDNNFLKRISQAVRRDDNFFQTDSPSHSNGWHFFGTDTHAVQTDNNFFQIDSPSCSNGWQFFLKGYPGPFKRIPNPFKKGNTFFKHRVPVLRGTQRQFSKNVCLEDNLRSRIFGAFVVKFLACLSLDFETSKKWYNTCPLFF